MSRPSAVVISPESPYPMHGGGAIRTASLLHYLSPRYDLDLILFRQAGDSDPALSIPAGLARDVRTITLPFHSRHKLSWLMRNGRRWVDGAPPLLDRFSGRGSEILEILQGRTYDVGLVEHFWCAPYIEQLKQTCRNTVIDLHNLESELHLSCGRSARWPLSSVHRRFAKSYFREEKRWLPQFSHILAASHDDASRVRRLIQNIPVTAYRNALPFVPLPVAPLPGESTEEYVIGFSGNFGYHPNIEAVRFFVGDIWPLLRRQHPALKLRLIGKNSEVIARFIEGVDNIETTGPVENAIAELAKLDVAIVPLLSGSGTRLKILEAWAAGKPVVSTTIGAEGLAARQDVNIVLSDTFSDFAASVSELLGSKERRRRIGCAARHTYEDVYTWESAWKVLSDEVF